MDTQKKNKQGNGQRYWQAAFLGLIVLILFLLYQSTLPKETVTDYVDGDNTGINNVTADTISYTTLVESLPAMSNIYQDDNCNFQYLSNRFLYAIYGKAGFFAQPNIINGVTNFEYLGMDYTPTDNKSHIIAYDVPSLTYNNIVFRYDTNDISISTLDINMQTSDMIIDGMTVEDIFNQRIEELGYDFEIELQNCYLGLPIVMDTSSIFGEEEYKKDPVYPLIAVVNDNGNYCGYLLGLLSQNGLLDISKDELDKVNDYNLYLEDSEVGAHNSTLHEIVISDTGEITLELFDISEAREDNQTIIIGDIFYPMPNGKLATYIPK